MRTLTCYRTVLEGEYNPDEMPAQLVRSVSENVNWFVDREAARFLS